MSEKTDSVAFALMKEILGIVKDSGADQTEAQCAIQAAAAMLPDLSLETKPTLMIQTDQRVP